MASMAVEQDAGALRHPISRKLVDDRTGGERLADTIAEQIGSWRFLIIQTSLVAVWIGINLAGAFLRWDPYPFVLLNLMFSVQAAYTGPILLLSQNRAATRDRVMAEHDYTVNEKSEQLTESLLSEVLRNSQATLAIAKHLGIQLDGIEELERALWTNSRPSPPGTGSNPQTKGSRTRTRTRTSRQCEGDFHLRLQ